MDHAGNVVVAGNSADASGLSNYVTIKYGPGGEILWARCYTGPTALQDNVSGMAVDAACNVYVTGTTTLDAAHFNYATVKYAPDGTERWAVRYTGPGNQDNACGIALDSAGDVYVSGSSVNLGARWDIVTIKYDSAGNLRWLERYDRPSTYDEAYAITVSRQWNVYVGGRTSIENNGIDYQTLCYGAAGAVTERSTHDARRMMPGAAVIRGCLHLPEASGVQRSASRVLLDISGRKAIDLRTGANDVRGLAPGVYFVPTSAGAVQRVMIVR